MRPAAVAALSVLLLGCQTAEDAEEPAPEPRPVAEAFVQALLDEGSAARAQELLAGDSPQRGGLIIPTGTVEAFQEWVLAWNMEARGAPEREGNRFVYRLQGGTSHMFRCGLLTVRMSSEAGSWKVYEFGYAGRTGSEGDFDRPPGAPAGEVCEPVFAGGHDGTFESWP
jgi:hypothetical protein